MSKKSKSERTLWDIAFEERLKVETSYQGPALIGKDDAKDEPRNSCILVCGSNLCGKSSMILRFLERDENPKPTVALDYTFGRRPRGHKMIKDVCHIYELGAGTNMSHLIENVINQASTNLCDLSVVIVVDLSKPGALWNTQDVIIKEVRRLVSKAFDELEHTSPSAAAKLKQKCWERIGENHVDRSLIDPLLVPLLIVGGKYDTYQEFEPEKKKIICKTLRFIAHRTGASLQFTSNKIDSLSSKTRSFFSNFGFNTTIGKSSMFDHNKPIIVHAGQDTFENIGAPPISSERMVRSKAGSPIDLWREAFLEYFPHEMSAKFELKGDPSKDQQYSEPMIDNIKLQKDQELSKYKKLSERKARETGNTSNQISNSSTKSKVKGK